MRNLWLERVQEIRVARRNEAESLDKTAEDLLDLATFIADCLQTPRDGKLITDSVHVTEVSSYLEGYLTNNNQIFNLDNPYQFALFELVKRILDERDVLDEDEFANLDSYKLTSNFGNSVSVMVNNWQYNLYLDSTQHSDITADFRVAIVEPSANEYEFPLEIDDLNLKLQPGDVFSTGDGTPIFKLICVDWDSVEIQLLCHPEA